MRIMYHPKGHRCRTVNVESENALVERGWRREPCPGVSYPVSSEIPFYGKWVEKIAPEPKTAAPVYFDEKSEPTEAKKELDKKNPRKDKGAGYGVRRRRKGIELGV